MQVLNIQILPSVKVVSTLFQFFHNLKSRNIGFPVAVGDFGVSGNFGAGAVGACVVVLIRRD